MYSLIRSTRACTVVLFVGFFLLASHSTFAQATAGQLIISEFRLRGPSGASDEFIEIYNTLNTAHTVVAASGTGYGVAASDGTTRCTIPNGTVIPPNGHFLCTNSIAYSLSGYPAGNGTTATGDATYTTDIPDNAGIALFNNNTGGGSYSLPNQLDAVGSTSEANPLYKEGTGYPALTPFNIEFSLYRNLSTGLPKDTNNNEVDFVLVDTQANIMCTSTANFQCQRLGAPGPENLFSSINRNALIPASLIAPCVAASQSPNRVRDPMPGPLLTSSQGTLDIRRRFTNNTGVPGVPVTQLRFRIVTITTFPAPSGVADLRAITSTALAPFANPCGAIPPTITVQGTTLEEPPSQPNGGAYNSTLSAGTITLTPLAPGASIDLRFLLGVKQTGSFRFFVNVEALP